MAISDLETNDRSTNNGYAFFRDVPKWSCSAVPRAQPVRPSPSPRTAATSDAPPRFVGPNVAERKRANYEHQQRRLTGSGLSIFDKTDLSSIPPLLVYPDDRR